MKRFFPWIVLSLVLITLAFSWRTPRRSPGDFDLNQFGQIPVLASGRLKPLDTVARNALVIIHGRQTLRLNHGRMLGATQWLADVMLNTPVANQYPIFTIHHPEVLGLFGWQKADRKAFSYDELVPFFGKIEGQALDSSHRSSYQTAIGNLRNALIVYQQLQLSMRPDVRFAAMRDAYSANNPEIFNRQVRELVSEMAAHEPMVMRRSAFECRFNQIEPFYRSMELYLIAFLLVCGSWLVGTPCLNRSALYVIMVALVLHTVGLAARMYLLGRPPVTNLYSSAVFVGWGTMAIGLMMERLSRDGIALACSAVVGFTTLIIAHHLAGNGDTLEMLSAVLDTNFWLATHVVSITLGYSAMFLAGTLAMFYVVRGVLTRSLTRDVARKLACMTYGVICFALLFSFVGTVLGGIWADRSWGRFWGWDPKENGALLVVLWCAIILHSRRARIIRQRGLMMLALFGNVVTSFSWFGVNMLGVGLHSYGFMESAFPWLIAFMTSQLIVMGMTVIPSHHWRSYLTELHAFRMKYPISQ